MASNSTSSSFQPTTLEDFHEEPITIDVAKSESNGRKKDTLYGRFKLVLNSQGKWISIDKKTASGLVAKVEKTVRDVTESQTSRNITAFTRSVMRILPDHYNYTFLFVLILGILVALVGVSMDLLINEINSLHHIMAPTSGESAYAKSYIGQYFVWTLFSIAFLLCAVFLTRTLAPAAAGSGIPEMKNILSGVYLSEYLSFKTLSIKVIGLVFAVGSGMFIGKEGPLVHAASIIANQLSKLTIFERIRKNPTLMQTMLAASVAAGIGANLGAPIGGVLFSIEVTSTYYPLRNYWYAYMASIVGAIAMRWLWNMRWGQPWLTAIAPTSFQHLEFTWLELVIFIIMGCVAALFGVLFIKLSFVSKKLWNKYYKRTASSPYVYAFLVAIVTSTLTFPHFVGESVGGESVESLHDLFSNSPLDADSVHAQDWDKPSIIGNLFIYVIIRFPLTAVSINTPVPAGLLMPLFATGAAMGRLFGEILKIALSSNASYYIVPGGWAVVGAASLVGSVTQAISTAVIILEITGQINYLLPIVLSVLVAVGISKKISSLSIYDAISKERGLPYLPDLQQYQYHASAKDIMDDKIVYLTKNFTSDQAKQALESVEYKEYPVVENQENMALIGLLDRADLEKFVSTNEDVMNTMHNVSIQIGQDTPLTHIHILFVTLRLFHCFVTHNGKLVGAVSRTVLKKAIANYDARVTIMKE